jgi:glycosyltransferase involved in cell wall biosynthesis
LTKYLFNRGINATVLNWERNYNAQEIAELGNNIDYFHSTPYGVNILIKNYGIAPEKCIATVHAKWDLNHLVEFDTDVVNQLHGYSVVSEWLVEQSQQAGIARVPVVTPVAINYETFHSEPSTQLRTVGFAGAVSGVHLNIKRPWLVEQAVKNAGLELKLAHGYHNSYATMAGYYKTVDALIVASTEEGAGLPALEASAAGKLVISTPVGLWLSRSSTNDHTVPIDEKQFVEETTALLEFYRDNPEAYRAKCLSTQQHARCYDWGVIIDSWERLMQ